MSRWAFQDVMYPGSVPTRFKLRNTRSIGERRAVVGIIPVTPALVHAIPPAPLAKLTLAILRSLIRVKQQACGLPCLSEVISSAFITRSVSGLHDKAQSTTRRAKRSISTAGHSPCAQMYVISQGYSRLDQEH